MGGMLTLGPLGFGAPLALLGLLALPVLWLLLRATPPAPREVIFAPLRLLQRVARTPETPDSAPWWLIIFRLLIAALAILALAQPVWRPDTGSQTEAPLLVVVDNGWTSAQGWPRLSGEARSRIEAAGADGRQVALVFTAPYPGDADEIRFGPSNAAVSRLQAAEPRAWRPDRGGAAQRLEAALAAEGAPSRFETVWLSDGLAGASEGDRELARLAAGRGRLVVALPGRDETALAISEVRAAADGFQADVIRAGGNGARSGELVALGADGQALARAALELPAGERTATAGARLPLDLRNRIRSVRIEGANSAGAVRLLDDAWRRPRIGLIEPSGGEDRQPLLSDLHYARQALAPHAELVRGELENVLAEEPSGLVMVDAARTEDPALEAFIEQGGLLIRFAGPRLAARGDDLLPVRLREGGRLFGGAMAWDTAQAIGRFPDDSPFAGLSVSEEATVSSQVLAEPGPDLDQRVWARLEDGTPLVTAERRGEGWIVLFHVTAGPDWSSLPLSGLYPAMLRRVIALAEGAGPGAAGEGNWQLERALDGFGRLQTRAPSQPRAIPAEEFDAARAAPDTPPGVWRLGAASAALNAVARGERFDALARDLPGATYETREGLREFRLAGPLLALAGLLFALDVLIALALSGRLPSVGRGAAAALALAFVLPLAPEALAQEEDADLAEAEAMDRALEVRFGYVETGDPETDSLSERGLLAVSRELTFRTAIEPGDPRGVDVETDPLIFYPLLYWPVTEATSRLSEEAAARVNNYLLAGGMILFDTRDGQAFGQGAANPALERLVESIDIPTLRRAPSDHVLGRAFYLLESYPGRYAGVDIWVEASEDGTARDGVSSVIIGSADWAGAWARAEGGMPMAPVEGGDRQREMAYRFGINLAMYALTGNYKADQVHVPAILERLGGSRQRTRQQIEGQPRP